jgi:hypothetical protein
MEKLNKKKQFPVLGVVFLSSNFIIGHYAAASDLVDFIRGLVVGIGIAFMIFPFLKKKAKIASWMSTLC